MADKEEVTDTCPKLNGTNFYEWRFKFKALCLKNGCWEAIEGFDDEDDVDPLEQTTQREKKKIENKCMGLLIRSVSDAYHDIIEECELAKEAYEKLGTECTNYTALHIAEFLDELVSVKKTDDITMQEYISKINCANKKLKESKEIILPDAAIAGLYLRGLRHNKKYESFMRSIELGEREFTTTKIRSKLILEELREQSGKDKEETESAVALKVQSKTKFNKNQKKYQSKKTENPKNKDEEKKEDTKKNYQRVVFCFCCGEKGHIATDCIKAKSDGNKKTEERKSEAKVVTRPYKALCAKQANPGEKKNQGIWLLDGGASDFMTPRRDLFRDFIPMKGEVLIGDGNPLKIEGKGKVLLNISPECGNFDLDIPEVLYVPELQDNLMSQGIFQRKGMKIVSYGETTNIYDGNELFLKCYLIGTLTFVTTANGNSIEELKAEYLKEERKASFVSTEVWHNRLGHVHQDAMFRIAPIVETGAKKMEDVCDSCIRGKMRRTSFPKKGESETKRVLEKIHSDVAGPIKPQSLGGSKFFVSFIDDYSNFITVLTMKKKSEVFHLFKNYQKKVELQLNVEIVEFQSDNGGEYVSIEFSKHLESCGITHKTTVAGTPSQNGKAERLNQTLLNSVRCMLIKSACPKIFWAEALDTASYLRNFCPSVSIGNKIPFEIWNDRPLALKDLKHLRVFGCQAWAAILNSGKLEERAEECVMLGYPKGQKGYKLWSLKRKRVIVSRDVHFQERKFPFKDKKKNETKKKNVWVDYEEDANSSEEEGQYNFYGNIRNEESSEEENEEEEDNEEEEENEVEEVETESDTSVQEDFEDIPENDEDQREEGGENNGGPRRSTREKKEKIPCQLSCCKLAKVLGDEEVEIPQTVQQALNSPHANQWKDAMNEEFEVLLEKETWELVKRRSNMNVIGCKWVFAIKRDHRGKVIKFKARLVAQGFRQIAGVDFGETYSPVMKRRCLRILVAIAVENDWEIHQVDVVAAYLNSPIDTPVYMNQPEMYEEDNKETFICKLNKSLYGLKQSGRNWNGFLHEILVKIGLIQCETDPCVYFQQDIIVGIHVDDMLVIGTCVQIKKLKAMISEEIKIKDLGPASMILSVKITRSTDGGVKIDQNLYIKKVLEELDGEKLYTHPAPLPTKVGIREEQNEENKFDDGKYRQGIGCILYAAGGSRPDIAYAVSKMSQYCERPTKEDWKKIEHILGYLKKTKEYGIHYSKSESPIEVYVDADYAGDTVDAVSVSGYVIKMANGAISWRSKKQSLPKNSKKPFQEGEEEPIVATSTTHAEYYALYEVTIEVEWLIQLLTELGQEKFVKKPIKIHVDNMGAIKLALKKDNSERTKNINVKYHYIRQLVKTNTIELAYVKSCKNQADIMTKALDGPRTKEISKSMGLSV